MQSMIVGELQPVLLWELEGQATRRQLGRICANSVWLEGVARDFVNDCDRNVVYAAMDVIADCRRARENASRARLLSFVPFADKLTQKFKKRAIECYLSLIENGRVLYHFTRPDLVAKLEYALEVEP